MKRLFWLFLLVSYAWGMTFGEYTHNLIHHFMDHHHHHSMPCLAAGFDEIAFDAGPDLSGLTQLASNECGFKLALHALGQPGILTATPLLLSSLVLHQVLLPAPHLQLWSKAVLIPSACPQAPPASPTFDA